MPERLSTSEWVAKARACWSDTYDYSKVEYVNNRTPVEVHCSKHGAWFPLPANHVRVAEPRGCPKCGAFRLAKQFLKPFDQFVAEAHAVHGETYIYLSDSYKGANEPMGISCGAHGEFWQRPSAHIRQRHGCPTCADELASARYASEYGVIVGNRISALSGGTVSMDKKSYRGINTKASFLCVKHGKFERLVNAALNNKHPCLKCVNPLVCHGGTADRLRAHMKREWPECSVEPFEYEGKRTIIRLRCPDHGGFHLAAAAVRRSPGCPTCARRASQANRTEGVRRRNSETLQQRHLAWVEAAQAFHGERFDYSRVIYVDARSGVIIGCPQHGYYKQAPGAHLHQGCRKCADSELKGLYSEDYFFRNPTETEVPALLYYLKFTATDEIFYKVGMTRTSLERRFAGVSAAGIRIEVMGTRSTTLLEACRAEALLINEHVSIHPYRPMLTKRPSARALRIGQSECFSMPLGEDTQLRFFAKTEARPTMSSRNNVAGECQRRVES